jgi:molybdate transport repressor ModE-like protein
MTREASLTRTDLRLLSALATIPNVVRAARAIGIDRDRAVYRLRRLARLYGPVTASARGGSRGGTTRLTEQGRRLLDRSTGRRRSANRWSGRYRRGPPASVDVGPGCRLEVAFRAPEGAWVSVELDPASVVLARRPAELSARNALPTVVERIRRRADGTATVLARWADRQIRTELTVGSVRRLGLRVGRPVILYAKAVSVRRVPTRGSPRP